MTNIDELKDMGFSLTHEIQALENELPDFLKINSDQSLLKASVYVWLSPNSNVANDMDVLYIGKAGYGTTRRFSQHRGGFRQSGPGTNCALIRDFIAAGRRIYVYGKVADEVEIFGVSIPRYSTEEEALCKRLSPMWNRATFPQTINQNQLPQRDKEAVSVLRDTLEEDTSLWFDRSKYREEGNVRANRPLRGRR